MFRRTIWFLVVACGCVSGAKPSKILNGNSFTELQLKNDSLQKVNKINIAIKNGETRTHEHRKKRGIVMVDSDFDIPSEIFNYENNVEAGLTFGKSEGSGTDELDEKESNGTTNAETEHETTSGYSQTTKRTSSTQTSTSTKMSATTEGKENITSSTPEEGSGDEISHFTETTITTSHTRHEYEVIPDICLNSTCSGDINVSVSYNESHFIPEGTNFTFACMGNSSNYNMLYWYKHNDSAYFLQAFGTEDELHLNFPDIRTVHSGTYMCVKWVDTQNCCNLKSSITVYRVPLYNYHLLIIGLIAIGCLIICIILSIRQSKVLKAYTKRFAEKHGSVKKQLI